MPPQRPDIESTDPEVTSSSGSSKTDLGATRHTENAPQRKASVAAKLRNPLTGFTEEQTLIDVETWCTEKGLTADLDSFRKGALIARVGQRDDGYEYVNILSEEEKAWLRHESTHRWSQPFMLYFLVVLCAGSAIVQGMDQTAVNGAQVRMLTHSPQEVLAELHVDFLLPRVRYHGCMAAGPSQRSSLSLLRCYRLLVQRTSQQVFRPPRDYLYLVHHLFHHWHLDGCCRQLVQLAHRAILPRVRRRCQIEYHAGVRG